MDRPERADRAGLPDRTDRPEPMEHADRPAPSLFPRAQDPVTLPRTRPGPAHALRTREPIYARLVAEWRAEGRTVPAEPDALWASFTGSAPLGRYRSGRP